MADPLIPAPGAAEPGTESPALMPRKKTLPFESRKSVTPAYDNPARQIEIFNSIKKQCLENRSVYERGWWRILMYLLRRQWIYYDSKRNQWRDKRLAQWIPRPTNTKMNEALQTIRSTFSSIEVGVIARPNGNAPENVATAEVADGMEPCIREDHRMDQVVNESDFWLGALGNVVWHPWWDAEDGEKVMLPASQCTACGLEYPPGDVDLGAQSCEACGMEGEGIIQPIPGTEVPVARGRGRTDVCSPLEILVPDYQKWDDVRELIRVRWRQKSYYEAFYPQLVEQIEWTKAPQERSIQLLKALATQSDLTSASSFSSGGSSNQENEGAVEYELWIKPTPEFPEGYIGRFVGEGETPILIEDANQSLPGPIPYRDSKDQPLWHWIHIGYDTFGGRLWAQGPMEGLIPLIDKLNRLDSRIELIVDRMSNPVWLEPKGSEVERITGMPGIVIKYHALGNNLGKPERLEGANIPATLFQLRDSILMEIEAAAATNDVLRGERPPNLEAFSAIQALLEQSQKRFTSAMKARGAGEREWYRLALEMERDFGPEERAKATLGPNRTWSYEIFKKADLTGSVTLLVEDGSTVPKTALGKRAAINDANQLRLINPLDPDQVHAILGDLGLKHLIPKIDKAVSAALREQHLYEEWVRGGRVEGESPLVRIDYVDDDPTHAAQHKMWAMSDAIRDLMLEDEMAMVEIQMHIYEHENGAFQKAIAQGMATGGGGKGAPGGAAGAGQAMGSSNRESGDPGDEGRTGNGDQIAA